MKEFFTLRKIGMLGITLALALVPSSAQQLRLNSSAQPKVMVNGHEVNRIFSCATAPEANVGRSQATTAKKVAATKTESLVIVDEDFSLVDKGSADEPYTDLPLCYAYGDPGWYVDSKYTHEDGWSGTNVYQAGGMVALMDPTGYSGACLNTPVGDHSGDLTITFRAKPLSSYTKTSTVFVSAVKGGFTNIVAADIDENGNSQQVNFIAGQGWKEVTVTMRNFSADADGYIQINCYGQILVDDIKVISTINFIADPVVQGVVEYNDSDFTVAWDPVRAAASYYVNLYKKEFTSESGLSFSADFEDSVLPESFTFAPAENLSFTESEGMDGSKGIVLHNGDTLTTPDVSALYQTMKFYMRMVAEEDPNDPYALYYTTIGVYGKSNGSWGKIGDFMGYYFMDGYYLDMLEAAGDDFADTYESIRFVVNDLPEGGYLVLDNFDITTDRQFAYTPVYDDALSYEGLYYDNVKTNQYTFYNLEPEADYYYSVRAKYLLMISENEPLYRAFGVAAPKLLPATDIDERGSYTANWESAPKATRYLITNYGLQIAEEDGLVTILEDDFDKVNADVTSATDPLSGTSVGNSTESSLDDYTSMPGWTGRGTSLAQGCLGGGYNSYSSWLKTPEMSLGNDSQYYLTITATGYYGSSLKIDDGTNTYTLSYEACEDGYTGAIDGEYVVPASGEIVRLKFSDNYSYPFAIDYIKVTQNVKAGDKIYTPIATYEATADETSHTFTGLDAWDYDNFAYSAMSYFDDGDETATSKVSRYMLVDLVNGSSVSGINSINANAEIVAIYSLDGTRQASLQKGVNIVKLSDGRTVKRIIK